MYLSLSLSLSLYLSLSLSLSLSPVQVLERSEICRDRLAASRARGIEGKTENETFTQRNLPVWPEISHVRESKSSKG